ncbi:MAG: hypothetical protein Kow00105_14200 [Phycisphaeraceae bacterium]
MLKHPVLGELDLPCEQVKSVTVETDDVSAPQVAPEQVHADKIRADSHQATAVPEAPTAGERLSNRFFPGWDKHFELGLTGTDGNTQTSNVRVGFTALREDDEQRTKLGLSHFRAEDDGILTRNEAAGEVTQDWLMPGSPWFKFANGKLEYDQFKDWETRASGFFGVGKQILDTDRHNLIGRVGGGGSYEFDSINEFVPEAMLGLEWVHNINDRQTLTGYITVFPDMDEFGESRSLAGGAWTIKIDQADGLSLKLGIDNEYESRTEGAAKHNDVKYYGTLVFDF